MKIVLDTDVVTAGLRSADGASRQWIEAALQRHFTLLLSVPLLLEYEATLKSPAQLAAIGSDAAGIDGFLDALATVAEPVLIDFLWRPILRDPGDEMVIETALNGGADFVLTFNRRDLTPAKPLPGLHIENPGEALRQARKEGWMT